MSLLGTLGVVSELEHFKPLGFLVLFGAVFRMSEFEGFKVLGCQVLGQDFLYLIVVLLWA